MSAAPVERARDPRLVAWVGTAILCALALPSAVALAIDERTLLGISVWAKPLKFDASLAIYLVTLVVLLGRIEPGRRERRGLGRVVLAGVFCALLEALYISLQAARGRPSHFNALSALESALYYGAMGPGAVVIVLAGFCVGWVLWRHAAAGVPEGLRLGGAFGLMLGAVATLVTAFILASGVVAGPGHAVGGDPGDATGLPLLGWSTTGGDLRVPHFFATHLMQWLPIAGWAADRLDPRRARAWVAVAAAVGLAAVAATLAMAIAGQPLIAIG